MKNENWKSKTFLVVDDNYNNRLYLSSAIQLKEGTVFSASSGDEAIRIFKSISSIDIVLLDIHMPGLSGYEVLSEMKKYNKSGRFIAATSDLNNMSLLEQAGFDDVLLKPIRLVLLKNIIAKQLGILYSKKTNSEV